MVLEQLDVIAAFLNAPITREIYIVMPRGFTNEQGKVRRLNKALYGLEEAPKLWNQHFIQFALELGLQQSALDPCLFTNEDMTIMMVVYVDDIMISTSTRQQR